MYEQTNLQGTYIVLSDDIANLNFYAFNDRAMSITVRLKNDKEYSENVVIYTKPYYIGESMTVPIGRSECGTNRLLNFCDNIYAGSIKVPMGFRVSEHQNLKGCDAGHKRGTRVDIRGVVQELNCFCE